ncbi:response regulator [Chitinophaga sp. 22321]|uniref:Response regulator n=1 Tax=Chitinophaga hostae TaxID=2831022 RepID=A0ABS5JAF1_9BACT|nr:response regulator [Chitinophaga hostae]MBS0032194.1 response regulator [Chitinophaga hostae]
MLANTGMGSLKGDPGKNGEENIVQAQEHAPDIFEKPSPGFLDGMTLLAVEDNPINQRVLGLQLKNSGVILSTAGNGLEALEKMQEQTFDGIILDLHMPEMNGYNTIPHIRRLQPDAFIIVLTADVMPEVSARLEKLQIKHMLAKPYAAEELLEKLKAESKKQKAIEAGQEQQL